jgi:Protein of unknown function (DUF2786)
MTEDQNRAIIEKIRKLAAKASCDATTEAEASAFASKVQEMLAAHNLDASILDDSDEDAREIDKEQMPVMYNDPWRRLLALRVAQLYFCSMYSSERYDERTHRMRPAIYFVGRAHNRAIALSMYDYLQSTVVRLSREYSRERADQLGFQRGCGVRLAERCQELHRLHAKPEVKHAPGSGLPALYQSENELIEDFKKNLGLVSISNRTRLDGAAAVAGGRAAEGISLGAQVGNSSMRGRMLA